MCKCYVQWDIVLSQYPTGHKSCDNEEVHPLQTKQPIKKKTKKKRVSVL